MVNSNNKELYVVKPTRFLIAPKKDKLISCRLYCRHVCNSVVRCDKATVSDLLEADLPTKYAFCISVTR